MTNTWRNSALRGVLFLMSKALVTSPAEHQHLISRSRDVFCCSVKEHQLSVCLQDHNHKQHGFAGSLKALRTCHYCSPTAGPLSEEQLTEHLKAPCEITAPHESHFQSQDLLQLSGTVKRNKINFKLHSTS